MEKLKIKTIKSIDLKLIFNQIKEIATLEGNTVSFDAFRIFELESILESHLIFPKNISNTSKHSLTQSIIKKVALQGFQLDNFEQILKEVTNNHFEKQDRVFYLLTSLSINFLPFKKLNINNSEIIIKGKNYPKEFKINRESVITTKVNQFEDNDFLKVIVKTKGKNFHDAFQESLNNLDTFRAILNLCLNPRMQIVFGPSETPINVIRYGHFFTMHYENGEMIDNYSYWTENNYSKKVFDFDKKLNKQLKNFIKWHLNKINSSEEKFNQQICNSLILYVNAFDNGDKQSCFLKSWTVLENLLSTHQNDLLIKRCLSIYSKNDKPMQKQILEGLRRFRNEFVHEGTELSNHTLLMFCYQIQNHIRNIITHNHLRFNHLFNHLDDANQFLDIKRLDKIVFNKNIEMLNEIKKIRKANNGSRCTSP